MLTPKQQRVYDAIVEYIRHYGQSPTLEELQNALELQNKHSVVQFLDYLDQKGYIEKGRGFRSIRLRDRIIASQLTFSIPILGIANAGRPLAYADEQNLGTLQVSRRIVSWDVKRYFFVRVDGTSMNKFSINGKQMTSWSYALIDAGVVQADNPFAAYLCIVSGCATLKKVKQQGDQLFLIPDSDDASHMPIILTQDDDVKIQGKVVDVFSFE